MLPIGVESASLHASYAGECLLQSLTRYVQPSLDCPQWCCSLLADGLKRLTVVVKSQQGVAVQRFKSCQALPDLGNLFVAEELFKW